MSTPRKRAHPGRRAGFLRHHSMSIVAGCILALWMALYSTWDPHTHLGAFFGNAIADWTGVLVTVIGTKYLYEIGSAESRKPPTHALAPVEEFLREHSLSIFLVVTGVVWAVLFAATSPDGKWGEVVGNILSEWTQLLGLVLLTKKLVEAGSKESHKR